MLPRKVWMLLLSLCMLMCILTINAGATTGGSCGDDLNWTLDNNGTLTITGTGKMSDFEWLSDTENTTAPWNDSYANIKRIVIQSGVTSIGDYSFTFAKNVEEVVLPEGLVSIGKLAFCKCTALQTITIPASVTMLGDCAFNDCTGMQNMIFLGNAPKLGGTYVIPTQVKIQYNPDTTGWDGENWANYTKEAVAFTAKITASDTTIHIGEYFYVQIQSDRPFAAAEIRLQFDSDHFSFMENTEGLLSDSYEFHGATVTVQDGILKLANYGNDKSFYKLPFVALQEGNASISLVSAKFSEAEDAIEKDLVDASVPTKSVEVTVLPARQSVTLPEYFDGEREVEYGSDYTFTVSGTNIYYDYDISATMGGEDVTVYREEYTYTIYNVTGPLVIQAKQTPKKFEIRFLWDDDETKALDTQMIPYGTDYTITFPTIEYYTVQMASIQYANKTGYTVSGVLSDAQYTINGTAIIDDIVVRFSRTQSEAIVKASGDVSDLKYECGATPGHAYSFTVNKDEKYTYTISATVNGKEVKLTENGNTYTIAGEDVQIGTIQINITKTLDISEFKVEEYLQLNGTKMWRIYFLTEMMEERSYVYKDTQLYWSEQYSGYCTLVIATEMPTIQNGDMTLQYASLQKVNYAMDVNKSGNVDANDAQLVYNMYNFMYSNFDEKATIEKFLRADINGDGTVDTKDAAAIINQIIQK